MRPSQRKQYLFLYFILFVLSRENIRFHQQRNMHFMVLELLRISEINRQRLMLRMLQMFQMENQRNGRRRIWAWPRPQNWFQILLERPEMDSLWKMHFRISRNTFEAVCDLVRTDLQKQDTRMRRATTVEKKVAVALWRLATGDSYKSTGLQFALGKSTAKMACKEFEEALARRKYQFIKFPITTTETEEKMNEFEEEYGIPQTVGAIDGCHLEINAPSRNKEDYFNRKQHYSVNLQAVVDCDLKFMHVAVCYPGSIHDARVLRLSGLYNLGNNKQILQSPTRIINGTEVPPLIVGDSAYPLLTWLVKPYQDRGRLSAEERKFNIKLSAMRSVVERAFGMLKLRWRLLYKKLEQKTKSLKKNCYCSLYSA